MIMSNIALLKEQLEKKTVKNRFEEILGSKAQGFAASIISLASSNTDLSKCEPNQIIQTALNAAILDLPIDKNLGFAYILPYNSKNGTQAQFQIGYKGFIQLAQRTGQYKKLNVVEIYEGQIKSQNPLTENYEFDFTVQSEKIVGFAAYMELINGFQKTVFWTTEQVNKHGKRFSKTFGKGFGIWADNYEAMAKKTVLKNMISHWGVLSIEMQKGLLFDQSSMKNEGVEYPDNVDAFDEALESAQAKKIKDGTENAGVV